MNNDIFRDITKRCDLIKNFKINAATTPNSVRMAWSIRIKNSPGMDIHGMISDEIVDFIHQIITNTLIDAIENSKEYKPVIILENSKKDDHLNNMFYEYIASEFFMYGTGGEVLVSHNMFRQLMCLPQAQVNALNDMYTCMLFGVNFKRFNIPDDYTIGLHTKEPFTINILRAQHHSDEFSLEFEHNITKENLYLKISSYVLC